LQELDEKKGGRRPTPSFISTAQELSRLVPLTEAERREIDLVSKTYPFRITPFYASLIDSDNRACPIGSQALPALAELQSAGREDPLAEGDINVTPSFLTRYPHRGVFLVSSQCAMYCRFCNRKRIVGKGPGWEDSTESTLAFLDGAREINEVILSGGDPLMLGAARLAYILDRLRSQRHIKVIRISTRVPVVFPEGMVDEYRVAFRKHGPIWLVIHINHPKEVTPEFREVTTGLREAGVLLVSQTVLLRGVNDCSHVLGRLFEELVRNGIKPYYLFQLDDVTGAQHFKVKLSSGINLMRVLRRDMSGLCIPHYALDITGGLGKVPVDYPYLKTRKGKALQLENTAGATGIYLDDGRRNRCSRCGLCGKKVART
jgi:lysine 2,3-aminomutase